MNTRRRKQIINLALQYLVNWSHELESVFEEVENDYQKENDILVDGKEMRVPNQKDMDQILGPLDVKGNWRTLELLKMALLFVQANEEDAKNFFIYKGQVERFVDTHVTVDNENFKFPSNEEFDEILSSLMSIYEKYPCVAVANQGWNVYGWDRGEGEGFQTIRVWVDKVFYNGDCDRDYVLRSLINHDNYDPDIVIARD